MFPARLSAHEWIVALTPSLPSLALGPNESRKSRTNSRRSGRRASRRSGDTRITSQPASVGPLLRVLGRVLATAGTWLIGASRTASRHVAVRDAPGKSAQVTSGALHASRKSAF